MLVIVLDLSTHIDVCRSSLSEMNCRNTQIFARNIRLASSLLNLSRYRLPNSMMFSILLLLHIQLVFSPVVSTCSAMFRFDYITHFFCMSLSGRSSFAQFHLLIWIFLFLFSLSRDVCSTRPFASSPLPAKIMMLTFCLLMFRDCLLPNAAIFTFYLKIFTKFFGTWFIAIAHFW